MQPFLLPFELNFKYEDYYKYHQKYWVLVLPTILVYLFGVFHGRKLMTTRSAFSLRRELLAWNVVLAIFSLIGAIRTVPDIIHTIWNNGLDYSICHKANLDGPYGVWFTLFILSKLVELGDTAFIVLRKQPLIFLHWYHHATVLFCVFFTVTRPLSTLRWYVTTNYTVHSIMYSYYALRAAGMKVPKLVAQLITTMQLIQMVIAFSITLYALVQKKSGSGCQVDDANIALALVCYTSYFVLFANFFIKAYLRKPKAAKAVEELDKNKNQLFPKKELLKNE
jgi:elongation of very long chain fatty acids protein 6